MSGHTKGPWSLNGHFNVTASGRGVATCGGWQDGKEGTFDENCANASLITAAPEMLEALKAWVALADEAVQTYGEDMVHPKEREVIRSARAVIAKAGGRP